MIEPEIKKLPWLWPFSKKYSLTLPIEALRWYGSLPGDTAKVWVSEKHFVVYPISKERAEELAKAWRVVWLVFGEMNLVFAPQFMV